MIRHIERDNDERVPENRDVPWHARPAEANIKRRMSSYLVSKVNTYAAANIRVEEGQKVISTGLYGLVRHPMYFGALFLAVGRYATRARLVVDAASHTALPAHSLFPDRKRRESAPARPAGIPGVQKQSPLSSHSLHLVVI